MLEIKTITAFISIDDEGEGIAAFQAPDGTWMPLVAADPARVESLRPIAQMIADSFGKEIEVVEFSVRTKIEEIFPRQIHPKQ